MARAAAATVVGGSMSRPSGGGGGARPSGGGAKTFGWRQCLAAFRRWRRLFQALGRRQRPASGGMFQAIANAVGATPSGGGGTCHRLGERPSGGDRPSAGNGASQLPSTNRPGGASVATASRPGVRRRHRGSSLASRPSRLRTTGPAPPTGRRSFPQDRNRPGTGAIAGSSRRRRSLAAPEQQGVGAVSSASPVVLRREPAGWAPAIGPAPGGRPGMADRPGAGERPALASIPA